MLINSYALAVAGGGPAGLVDFTNCKLLLHMNGTNGSTTIDDDSTFVHTADIVCASGAVLDTSFKKYGSASLALANGATDGLQINNSSDYDITTEDFSLEFWHYDTGALNTNRILVFKYNFSSVEPLRIFIGNDNKLHAYSTDNTGTVQASVDDPGTTTQNAWHHYAYCRSAGVFYLYKDGIMVATVSPGAFTFGDNAGKIYVNGGGNQGWVDDFRFVVGESAYDGSNFTPPGAELPNS